MSGVGGVSTRTRLLKSGLAIAIAVLLAAAAAVTASVLQYRGANRNMAVYAAVWALADVVVDLHRFQQTVTTYELDDGTASVEDVVAVYRDLLSSVLRIRDLPAPGVPADPKLIGDLVTAVDQAGVLVERVAEPGFALAARRQFEHLTPRTVEAATVANRFAAALVGQETSDLYRLYWILASLGAAVATLAAGMIALLVRQNRLLSEAHGGLTDLTASLEQTAAQLAAANTAVEAANEELREQNSKSFASEVAARIQSARFSAALENMQEGLSMFDGAGNLTVCNQRFIEMYRFPADQTLIGRNVSDIVVHYIKMGFVTPDTATSLRDLGRTAVPHTVSLELGDGRCIEVNRRPLKEGGWVATHEDITERRRAERKLQFLAAHDGLTGLANRANFVSCLDLRLAPAATGDVDERIAVISFDLDRFKQVNDLYGHAAGDALLCQIARRAEETLAGRGVLARFGGDEFAVMLAPVAGTAEAVAFAERLVGELTLPVLIGGSLLEVGSSFGIALSPDHGLDSETLIRRADAALYEAKAAGRRVCRVFDFSMDERLKARRSLEADLRRALGSDQLEMHYQPIIDIDSGRTVAAEALIRWNHPGLGRISPDVFIPIAEESGLIAPLGEWVLRTACREAVSWPSEIGLAVNLSAAQLKHPGLATTVLQAISSTGFDPRRLELEMTETIFFDDDNALDVMRSLRRLGVRFSLDDFGTGYSSLSYLRRFEFDKIKIDQTFLRDSAERADCEVIVRAIGALGLSLGIDTVAEGIESERELAIARSAGCRFAQGFLFGRPVEAAAIGERLKLEERQPDPAASAHWPPAAETRTAEISRGSRRKIAGAA